MESCMDVNLQLGGGRTHGGEGGDDRLFLCLIIEDLPGIDLPERIFDEVPGKVRADAV